MTKKSIAEATLEEILFDIGAEEPDELLLGAKSNELITINTLDKGENPGVGRTLREALINFQVNFLEDVNWDEDELRPLLLDWAELKGRRGAQT